jgi:hypothetical protein
MSEQDKPDRDTILDCLAETLMKTNATIMGCAEEWDVKISIRPVQLDREYLGFHVQFPDGWEMEMKPQKR